MPREVLVFGASGHSMVVKDAIELAGSFVIRAFVELMPKEQKRWGYDLVSDEKGLMLAACIGRGVVAVGDNNLRAALVRKICLAVPNFEFVSVRHPSAVVATGSEIGAGTVIMANAVINPGVTVGEHCVINTSSSIDHECALDDFVSISPGAVLGGNVKVGASSWVGLGARVIQGVNIGKDVVVGAAACVIRNIPDSTVAVGVPARVIKSRARVESQS